MTACHPIPAGAVLVAIDISKYRHEVLIEIPGRKRRRRLTILNAREDLDRLVTVLSSFDGMVVVGFEATGNYHRAIAHHLLLAGFELRLISSMALARTREALTNGWDKNDPRDAQVILHMLRIDTRLGTLNLRVPELRQGSYFLGFLEARKTSEQALVAVVQEAWIGGVSTHRVDKLVRAMGLGGRKSRGLSPRYSRPGGTSKGTAARPARQRACAVP